MCVDLSRLAISNSFTTPWTVARQAHLSIGFLRQDYWSGLPFPSPGDLLDTEIKPTSPALASGFFTTEPLWKPLSTSKNHPRMVFILWEIIPSCHFWGKLWDWAYLQWTEHPAWFWSSCFVWGLPVWEEMAGYSIGCHVAPGNTVHGGNGAV